MAGDGFSRGTSMFPRGKDPIARLPGSWERRTPQGDAAAATAPDVPAMSLRCPCDVPGATHPPQGVHVDLAPLPALAEEHGRSHQQDVGDAVAVHVQGIDLAAVVGADLQETGWDGNDAITPWDP